MQCSKLPRTQNAFKKKQELSKIEYYNWNKEQREKREKGNSDFYRKISTMQKDVEHQH